MDNLKECIVCKNKKTTYLCSNTAMMHVGTKEFKFFICEICNLVFLNPRISKDQLKEYYKDFYLPYRGPSAWGKYQKFAELSQKRVDDRRTKMLRRYSSPDKESIILDIGCGNPTFLETCNFFFESSLYGIDFSDHGWKKEKDRFKMLNLEVRDVDDLKPNFSPHIITLWHYLEHDYYPNKTLSKLASISNSKTKLYIEVPNYNSNSRKKFNENWAGFHTPRHTFLFSPKNIEILLNNNGWEIDFIEQKGTINPYILTWMSEMEIKGLNWSDSMENQFLNFFCGMIKHKFRQLFTNISDGNMTVIAKKIDNLS